MKKDGFTLRELLVVLVVFGIGLLILATMVRREMFRARVTAVLSNGRMLYTALCPPEVDSALALYRTPYSWPQSDPTNALLRFRNSSALFDFLIQSNLLDVSYNFFIAPGGDVKAAQDSKEFLDGTLRNTWCITLDVNDGMKSGAPVLFSQNFRFSSRSSDATIDRMTGLESLARPYGGRCGVEIVRGGAGFMLDATTAVATNFNPTQATNGFLWPLSSGQDLSMK